MDNQTDPKNALLIFFFKKEPLKESYSTPFLSYIPETGYPMSVRYLQRMLESGEG